MNNLTPWWTPHLHKQQLATHTTSAYNKDGTQDKFSDISNDKKLVIIITSLTARVMSSAEQISAKFLRIIKSYGDKDASTFITFAYKPGNPKVLFGSKGNYNKYLLTWVTSVFIPNSSSCLYSISEEIIP